LCSLIKAKEVDTGVKKVLANLNVLIIAYWGYFKEVVLYQFTREGNLRVDSETEIAEQAFKF